MNAPAQVPAIPIWGKWQQTQTFKELVRDIWNDNPTFRMVLALCPTMGATNMAINGFAMAAATMFATAASCVTISFLRNAIPHEVRTAAYMIIIAAYVSVVDIVLKAFFPPLSQALDPYVPLIITKRGPPLNGSKEGSDKYG